MICSYPTSYPGAPRLPQPIGRTKREGDTVEERDLEKER
jgi:hypothetical protein